MTDTQPLWTTTDIREATNCETNCEAANINITGVSIDSRDIRAGDLFVALPGTMSDGHEFLGAAHTAGASAAIVNKINHQLDLPQMCVTDCLEALRQLAIVGRARFGGMQFGITGSVGKTGSKELLRQALSQFGKCHASQRSFNNHIGVPISLANLPPGANFAIQEMGMNATGEIADLTRLTRPNIALVTRIADNHSEFFASTADIAEAKAEIFQAIEGPSIAILNRDDTFYETLYDAATVAGAKQVIGFGHHADAEFRLVSIAHHDAGMTIEANSPVPIVFLKCKCTAVTCIQWAWLVLQRRVCLRRKLGFIGQLPTAKRTWTILVAFNCAISIIDDSYNASPASMAAAFSSLAKTPPSIMVLSEMRELGAAASTAHAALAPQINKLAPRIVIAIGPAMHDMLCGLDKSITCFAARDINAALLELDHSITADDRIFIKGSNGSGAWQVRDALCAAMRPDVPLRKLKGASHAA